ncbi:MAG: aldo/keto reductase [Candidatus Lokiarchaeota archaeon]|nr:aldo/keto reductase [Candidatus Lokiarchaeota archaeon]
MQYRKMGKRIPWEASALGFGCMRFPSKKILGFIKKVDETEAIRILRHAIDNGVNYVDTAYGYHAGKSEIIVGKALQDGYRQKVHLVTKCPMWKVKAAGDVEKYCREQLAKLQTDHLDIYIFHGLNKSRLKQVKDLNLIGEMEKLKEKGLIKHFGFSFHDNFQVFKEIIDLYPNWEMAQVQYNYMDTSNQATTQGIEYAASKGVAVVIMEPLRGGKLANPTPEVKALFDAATKKRTPVDWALQFLWNRPEISTVLSGMSSMEQVQQNLASADKSGVGTLSNEEVSLLDRVAEIFRKAILIPCTGCDYCIEACPRKIKIPRNFALINQLSTSKDDKKARNEYKKLSKQNGSAASCKDCKACMERCPQQIDIPAMLRKVDAVLTGQQPLDQAFPRK